MIGEKMQTTSLDLLISIYHANASFSNERIKHIQKVISLIETLRMCARLSVDLKIISTKLFANLSESIESIGKQSLAWRNSTQTGELVR